MTGIKEYGIEEIVEMKVSECSAYRKVSMTYNFVAACVCVCVCACVKVCVSYCSIKCRRFLGGPVVKNLSANSGTRVGSLVWDESPCLGTTKPMHCHY